MCEIATCDMVYPFLSSCPLALEPITLLLKPLLLIFFHFFLSTFHLSKHFQKLIPNLNSASITKWLLCSLPCRCRQPFFTPFIPLPLRLLLNQCPLSHRRFSQSPKSSRYRLPLPLSSTPLSIWNPFPLRLDPQTSAMATHSLYGCPGTAHSPQSSWSYREGIWRYINF